MDTCSASSEIPEHGAQREAALTAADAPEGAAPLPRLFDQKTPPRRKGPSQTKKKRKRRKRRVQKRFYAFLALLCLLLGGTAALAVFQPWKQFQPAADPYRGTWTARTVAYMGNEYAAAQLFPNGVPELTITRYRVALTFSGNSGKGKRTNADGAIRFACLGKTYTVTCRDSVLEMDMSGMLLRFSQTPDEGAAGGDAAEAMPGDPIVGTWTAEAYRSDKHGPGYASDLFQTGCTIRFAADGTGRITVDAYTEEITWQAQQDAVTITGTIMFPALTLRDGRLYGTYGRSGITLQFDKSGD